MFSSSLWRGEGLDLPGPRVNAGHLEPIVPWAGVFALALGSSAYSMSMGLSIFPTTTKRPTIIKVEPATVDPGGSDGGTWRRCCGPAQPRHLLGGGRSRRALLLLVHKCAPAHPLSSISLWQSDSWAASQIRHVCLLGCRCTYGCWVSTEQPEAGLWPHKNTRMLRLGLTARPRQTSATLTMLSSLTFSLQESGS